MICIKALMSLSCGHSPLLPTELAVLKHLENIVYSDFLGYIYSDQLNDCR